MPRQSLQVEDWLRPLLEAQEGVTVEAFYELGVTHNDGKVKNGLVLTFADGSCYHLAITRRAYPNQPDVCMAPGCTNKPQKLGYCNPHYHRLLRYGEATAGTRDVGRTLYRQPDQCQYPGCDKVGENIAKGLCWQHYQALRRASQRLTGAPEE